MSEPTPNERPRQVTLAGWLTMVGSIVVVLLVFERVAGLHTLETREAAEQFLAEPPGRDLGLGVDHVISIMRTAALVAGGCAAAAAILGYQVLQRSRSARLALTVLAVPLFVAGMVTGGFVSSLVAASAAMLWLQPSRDWFDGITRRPEPRPGPAAAPAPGPDTTSAPVQASPQAPMAGSAAASWAGPAATPAARPAAVTWACILTWAGSGLTLLGTIASGVLLGLDPDVLIDQVRRESPELESQGVTDELLIGTTFAMLAGFALWSLAASVVAGFALRGREWARVALIVSAATAAAIFLVGTVVGAFLLAGTFATAAATVVLLIRPESKAWFLSVRGPRPPVGAAPPR